MQEVREPLLGVESYGVEFDGNGLHRPEHGRCGVTACVTNIFEP